MKPFFSGVLGGAVLLTIVAVFCFFSMNLHVYKVAVVNDKPSDSLAVFNDRNDIIKELHDNGVILTPQEYTNNVVNYYNTAITLLVFLFVIFSFVSYYHLKALSKDEMRKLLEDKIKDSKEIEEMFLEAFTGLADERYQSREDADEWREIIEGYKKKIDKSMEGEESTPNGQII